MEEIVSITFATYGDSLELFFTILFPGIGSSDLASCEGAKPDAAECFLARRKADPNEHWMNVDDSNRGDNEASKKYSNKVQDSKRDKTFLFLPFYFNC